MDVSPLRKKERGLTQDAFDSLLAHLDDADKERAGERYEQIRRKLVKFFEWRGCLQAEDLADETINRVARKYSEGATIQDPSTYCFGVARLIILETFKERERELSGLKHLSLHQAEEEARSEPDARVECFEDCLSKLSGESRDMMIDYYKGEKHAKIENRKRLAEQMGIPLGNLRIRAHRIRARIEQCIGECLGQRQHG